jgi:hypothetical protein
LGLGWQPLLLLAGMQLLVRPLSVWLSTLGSTLRWQEKALLAWVAPRGIVAAAVSALFKLEAAGEPEASLLVPLTFSVIFGTVILQSASARPLAKWLGVIEPPPHGVLILGANNIARALARELKKHNIRTLLTDTSHDNIRAARMDGLETFYGNPASDYAEARLDLTGLGKLLALSPDSRANAVAGIRFREEFGIRHVYSLQTSSESQQTGKHRHSDEHSGRRLFAGHMTWGKFASLLAQGGSLHSTRLSKEFTFDNFCQKHGTEATPLLIITPADSNTGSRATPCVMNEVPQPRPGQILISLYNKPLTDRLNEEREKA